MATDVEKLVVQLSADVKKYENAMRKAVSESTRTANSIERNFRTMNTGVADSFASLGSKLAIFTGSALSIREVQRYADTWTTAGNKVAAAGQVSGLQGRSLEELREGADSARASMAQYVDLYSRMLRSSAGVAQSEQQVAIATNSVAKAFRAGGASAQEQEAGLNQLGQALGSGVLQGEELNSLRENAPLVAKAIADAFGTTIGGLKELGATGQLTSYRVFKAILDATPEINAAFNVTAQTIQDGYTRVSNAFTQYIGQTDDGLGATERLTAGLNALADNFDTVADATLRVASVIAAALVGRSIAGLIVKLGVSTAAVIKFVQALKSAIAVGQLSTVIGGLSTAAGPIGAVIGVTAVSALALFAASSGDAAEGAEIYKKALEGVVEAAQKAAAGVENAVPRMRNALANDLAKGAEEGDRRIAEALDDVNSELNGTLAYYQALIDTGRGSLFAFKVDPSIIPALQDIKRGLDDNSLSAEGAREKLYALANSNPNFQAIADELGPLLQALANASAATINLKDQLDAVANSRPYDDLYKSIEGTREAGAQMVQDGKDYLADLEKQNTLTSEQLALQKKVALIKSGLKQSGGYASDQDIVSAAQSQIDAEERRAKVTRDAAKADREAERASGSAATAAEKKTEKYQKTVDAIQEEIDNTRIQTEVNAAAGVATDDYGYALERATTAQKLLSSAKANDIQAGKELSNVHQLLSGDFSTLSPLAQQQAAAMLALAENSAQATAESKKLSESQQFLTSSISGIRDASKSAISGFISDIRDGETAADALASAIDTISDKLIDMALDAAFSGQNLSGLFSNISSLFSSSSSSAISSATSGLYKNGGVVKKFASGGQISGAGTGKSDSIVAAGPNGPIRVSNGEYIVNAEATKKNLGLLSAINNGAVPQFASGGSIGNVTGSGIRSSTPASINVTVSMDKNSNLQTYVTSTSAQVSAQTVQQAAPTLVSKSTTAAGQALQRGQYAAGMARYGTKRTANTR